MKMKLVALRLLVREAIEGVGAVMNGGLDPGQYPQHQIAELQDQLARARAAGHSVDALERAWHQHDRFSAKLVRLWNTDRFTDPDLWPRIIDDALDLVSSVEALDAGVVNDTSRTQRIMMNAVANENWELALIHVDELRSWCHGALRAMIDEWAPPV